MLKDAGNLEMGLQVRSLKVLSAALIVVAST